jgi:hypothetical protein
MSQTYDNKAITGADLETILTSAASEIKKKQDDLDIEIDVVNKRLKFNNVAFTVTTAE